MGDITLEIVIVLIKFDHKIVIITFIYIPNKAFIDVYSKYFKVINDIYYNYSNSDLILLGDFNIPSAISTNTKDLFFDNIYFLNVLSFVLKKMIFFIMLYQTIILLM